MNNIGTPYKLRDFAAVSGAETAIATTTVMEVVPIGNYERAKAIVSVSIAAGGAGASMVMYARIPGETEWFEVSDINTVVNGTIVDLGAFDVNLEYCVIVDVIASGALTGSFWIQGYNQKGD